MPRMCAKALSIQINLHALMTVPARRGTCTCTAYMHSIHAAVKLLE